MNHSPRMHAVQWHHISISTVQRAKSQKACANDCMHPVTLHTCLLFSLILCLQGLWTLRTKLALKVEQNLSSKHSSLLQWYICFWIHCIYFLRRDASCTAFIQLLNIFPEWTQLDLVCMTICTMLIYNW